MSQMNETGKLSVVAGAARAAFLRVYNSSGTWTTADATHAGQGTQLVPSLTTTEYVTLKGCSAPGTHKMTAAGIIAIGGTCYAAAAGKIAATGTIIEGIALEAAGADGDIIEVLPLHNTDVSVASTGTTASAFEIDSDAATPKIALAGQTAGTGDFTTTIKPEATLSADTYCIVPETTDGDTLMACTLAQTVPGIKTFTGGIIMSGAVDLDFQGTTGQPEIKLTTNLADALSVKDSAGDLIVFDLTTGTQVITITPAVTVTGLITSNGGVTLSGAVDLTFSGTTGQSEVVVQPNLADALSIKSSAGDIAVLDTTTGATALGLTTRLTITDSVASGTAKRVGGLAYCLAAAGSAHTNSTDETVLASYELPANSIKAGTIVKIRYQGIATAQAGATTLTVNLRIGPTTLTGTVVQTHPAHAITANDIFEGEFTLIGRAAPGAAAACVGVGNFGPTADAYDADLTLARISNIMASTNFATNGALKIELTADWSAADASSCRADIFIVEVI